ncbi:hypothetical protein AX16_009546 [Volvariella volvacea WC 439]|nr:hypothetical protein AX16_009546 [Volvariella volvacea WC 439]
MSAPGDSLVPSLSSGPVGSRFITQDEIESAKARREEQWKAAYARFVSVVPSTTFFSGKPFLFSPSSLYSRLGQEPPPQQQEDYHDGRSLAEKLAANRAAKQEEWEERNKLANQFRALEEDEIMFLDSVRERQEAEERERRQKDGEEVRSFKEAVAARERALSSTPALLNNKPTGTAQPKPTIAPKKDQKRSLKGVVVKKKSKPSAPAATSQGSASAPTPPNNRDPSLSPKIEGPQAKRRKLEE